MARREVEVRIGAAGVPVGRLIVEEDGSRVVSTFLYHESWIAESRGFDLAPDMPRRTAPFSRRKTREASSLPGAMEDGAPDSWGRKVLDLTSGGATLGDLDYLVGADDALRVGALRYFDRAGAEGAALAQPAAGAGVPRLHALSDVVLAARAFDADPHGYAQKRAHLVGGDILRQAVGSLGGARPKVNAVDENGAPWIVKLPKQADTYAMARAEAMALRLAAMVGIQVAVAHVMNDAPHFPMIRILRFDRTGPRYDARVPYISAQTFLGGDLGRAGSYDDIAMAMRAHAANPQDQIRELYRRMCFGVLLRNTDDHLRNHGFLRTGRGWVLSPAFDINPESRPGGALQTPISEIHGSRCSIGAALDAALLFDVSPADARAMVKSMAETVSHNWRIVGRQLGMTTGDAYALASVIENPDLDLARRL